MQLEILCLRAVLWSVFCAVILHRRQLRPCGGGFAAVRPVKIAGCAAALCALIWSLDSSETLSVGSLRGGAPSEDAENRKRNPIFRTRKRDGSRRREALLNMNATFSAMEPLKVRYQGQEQNMTAMQIEQFAREKWNQAAGTWHIVERSGRLTPLTIELLMKYNSIDIRLSEAHCFVDSVGELVTLPGKDGFMAIPTRGGSIEVPEDELQDWILVNRYDTDQLEIGVVGSENTFKIDIEGLVGEFDGLLEDHGFEVFNVLEGKYTILSMYWLDKLLDHENRASVAWEKDWIPVNQDFFTFMFQRIELSERNEHTPQQQAPPSLQRFIAPAGFDPIKLDRDGMFLVTPRMETLERERPVFTFTYIHIRGYCYKHRSFFGADCVVIPQDAPSYTIRGLTEYDREIDDVRFDKPDLGILADALKRKYEQNPSYATLVGQLQRFFVPLTGEGEMSLAELFLQRGQYFQQYAEVRTYLGWLQKTFESAGRFEFEEKMSGWVESPANSHGVYVVQRHVLIEHITGLGFKVPFFGCREPVGPGPAEAKKRLLQTITLCLNRDFENVDCEKPSSCGNEFYMLKRTIGF